MPDLEVEVKSHWPFCRTSSLLWLIYYISEKNQTTVDYRPLSTQPDSWLKIKKIKSLSWVFMVKEDNSPKLKLPMKTRRTCFTR